MYDFLTRNGWRRPRADGSEGATSVKNLLGIIALIIATVGMSNFFISIGRPTPIPVAVSHPLAMIAMAYLLFQHILPRMLYATTSQNYTEIIEQLRSTGGQIASGWTGGSIGLLHFRGPLIGVYVFPGGVLIKPTLLPTAPILREEITAIQEGWQPFASVIEIHHLSNRIRTPLMLQFSKHSNIGKALLQLKSPTKQ